MKKENIWPIGITIFFILFVAIFVTLLIYSRTVPVNLVSKNYYQKAVHFQEHIESVERASTLKESVQLQYDKTQQSLALWFPKQKTDSPTEGQINFFRPSDSRMDFKIPLKPDTEGRQMIDLSGLKTGYWKVQIEWKTGREDYYLEKPLTIQ